MPGYTKVSQKIIVGSGKIGEVGEAEASVSLITETI